MIKFMRWWLLSNLNYNLGNVDISLQSLLHHVLYEQNDKPYAVHYHKSAYGHFCSLVCPQRALVRKGENFFCYFYTQLKISLFITICFVLEFLFSSGSCVTSQNRDASAKFRLQQNTKSVNLGTLQFCSK